MMAEPHDGQPVNQDTAQDIERLLAWELGAMKFEDRERLMEENMESVREHLRRPRRCWRNP